MPPRLSRSIRNPSAAAGVSRRSKACCSTATSSRTARGLAASFAGFIMSRLVEDEAEILSVAVARANQGRGLARKLLDLHLRRLAGLGARAVFLEVDEHNRPAIKLYDRAGFQPISRRPNYYQVAGGGTAVALVLRRDL